MNKYQFSKLLLTDKVLDTLGFTEYWGECGEFGNRQLYLQAEDADPIPLAKGEFPRYLIYEMDELPYGQDAGYALVTKYEAAYFSTKDFFPIYFLHEMYEDIVCRRAPEEVEFFTDLLKKKGVNMYPYIEEYLRWKQIQTTGNSRTSEFWLQDPEFATVKILDPDGWDRSGDFYYSFFEEKISREEFQSRLARSTASLFKS